MGLRNRIQEQFERAEFLVDPEARLDALRFVVVGGGPTGVEFAGTLSDFISRDLVKRFPLLVPLVQVCILSLILHSCVTMTVLYLFERAEFLVDPEARLDALRFVGGGGGPTGVEFAGTLSDFISRDLVKRFPLLVPLVQVCVF